MKALLKKLAGAHRHKVIAIVAVSREDAKAAISHARTSGESIPIWVWCAETGDAPAACDRYAGGAGAAQIVREMHQVWPALSITGWTGRRMNVLTLTPFIFPPLRIVIFNEAHGFSAAKPAFIADHVGRRLRDAARSALIRLGDWTPLNQTVEPLYRISIRRAPARHFPLDLELHPRVRCILRAGPCATELRGYAASAHGRHRAPPNAAGH